MDAQQGAVQDTVVLRPAAGLARAVRAWTGYLDSQTPADLLIRKMEYADTLVEDQEQPLRPAARRRAGAAREEGRGEGRRGGRRRAGGPRGAAADQHRQHLKNGGSQAANDALLAQDQVTLTVAAREKAQHKAERAKAKDEAELAKLKAGRVQDEQADPRRRPDRSTGFVGADDGFLMSPVNSVVASPFGYRVPTPIYGYWGLHRRHRLRRRLRPGHARRCRRQGECRATTPVYGNRLYLDVGKVNGHNLTVVYNHATSYRVGKHVGDTVARGETLGYAGSTGWSPAATSTSRSCRTAPLDPMDQVLLGRLASLDDNPVVACTRSPGWPRTAPRSSRRTASATPRLRHRGHLRGRPRAPQGAEVKSLREGRASLRWTGSWTSTGARRGCATSTSRSTPRRLDRPLPRAAQAQAAVRPRRDRQDRAPGEREGVHDRALCALLPQRPGQGRDRPGRRSSWDKRHALAERQADPRRGGPWVAASRDPIMKNRTPADRACRDHRRHRQVPATSRPVPRLLGGARAARRPSRRARALPHPQHPGTDAAGLFDTGQGPKIG